MKDFRKKIEENIEEILIEIKNIKYLEGLKILKSKYLSKSDFLNDLKQELKYSDNKSEIGKLINYYTSKISEIINEKKDELESSFFLVEKENVFFNDKLIKLKEKKGYIHPLTNISFLVQDFFDGLNYVYAHGIEVEEEKFNFDILNMPNNHPAREMQDTFYLEEKGMLLRTHATNITARELLKTKRSIFKSYSIGSVFRNDDNDATHSFQFNQIDIFSISNNTSLADLKYTLNNLVNKLFGKKLKTRYRLSYFPFTEPSFEVDIECPNCENKGCSICQKSGWIEILGSGMISPYVLKNANKDPKKIQGFAAGLGVERIAMIKWNINDIRNFFINDLNFLKGYDK